MFFRFPPDARWNLEWLAVEFGIGVGDHEGVVRIPRRVFQSLLEQTPIPERCLEAYHLYRTRLELIAERKVGRRQLTDDGNIEITGRDLREREHRTPWVTVNFERVASCARYNKFLKMKVDLPFGSGSRFQQRASADNSFR